MSNTPEIPASPPSPHPLEQQHDMNKKKRAGALFWTTLVLAVFALGWLLVWVFYLQYHEFTDDAYANGNMINVNSVVPGMTIAYFADNTDLVEEGQLLILLDDTDYQIRFERELSVLANVVLDVRRLYDEVKVNVANVENRRTILERARYDFENRSKLVGNLAISNEDYIHSKDDFTIAEINLRQAEYQLKMALDAVGNSTIDKHPRIEAQRARVREAYYNFKHCAIYAPARGYVAQRTVEVGQWLTPTTNTMAIIPTDYMWVDANFKETQLTYMRIGQPATVTFDIFGRGVVFEGKVLGIASGTGSVFSLIPPQNATGNWIKIVQRLPVRISVDPKMLNEHPLRLGLSANVDVNISQKDLPVLASTPTRLPVGITEVFDFDFDEVEKLMNQIVKENLE